MRGVLRDAARLYENQSGVSVAFGPDARHSALVKQTRSSRNGVYSICARQAPVFSRQPRLPSPFGQFVYTFPLFRRVPGAPCRPLKA